MIQYENQVYLTTEEAAKFLGKNTTSFRQFYYRSKLPRRKLGGRLYFAQKDLDGLFAGGKYRHFEKSGLSYGEAYTIEQLIGIFLTSKQNIYAFIARNKITRYRDNTGKTLYNKEQIDKCLNQVKAVISRKEVNDL